MNYIRQHIVSSWPVFFLSGLLLVLGMGSAWYVNHLFRGLSEVLEVNVASVRAAEELEIGLREIHLYLRESVHTGMDPGTTDFKTLISNSDRWLLEVDRLATTSQEQEILRRLKTSYAEFIRSFEHLLSLNPVGTRNDIKEIRRIESILMNEIIEPAHEYLDFNEATMLNAVKDHQSLSEKMSLLLLVVAISGSLGGFVLGAFALRKISRSLIELNLPLSLAAGKLSEVVGPIQLSTSLDLVELRRVLVEIAAEVERVVIRLQRSQEEVLRSEKLATIGRLAGNAAHEIRNPLMSIKLLVQAALANGITETLTESDLLMIEQEICRLEQTVQNLLEFGRPPRIEKVNFSFSGLIDHCLKLMEGRADLKNIRLSRIDNEGEVFIKADFNQLEQVIVNLLINAIEACETGGHIELIVEREISPHKKLKFSIQDDGIGIPQNLLEKIFEPFVSSKQEGTGIGLSISRQIIHAHGGEMFARNREGGGAKVGFYMEHYED